MNSAHEALVIRDLMRRLQLSYVEIKPPVDLPATCKIETGLDPESDAIWIRINGDDPLPEGRVPLIQHRPPQNWVEMIAALGLGCARIGVLIVMLAAVVRLTVGGVQWVWSLGGFCG